MNTMSVDYILCVWYYSVRNGVCVCVCDIILNICKCMRIYMYEIYIRDATIPSMDKITEVNYLRMDYTDGLSYTGYDNKIILCMHCFPLHSPLLRESWLVSIIALRRLICLSLARILTWADVPCGMSVKIYIVNCAENYIDCLIPSCMQVCEYSFHCVIVNYDSCVNIYMHCKWYYIIIDAS